MCGAKPFIKHIKLAYIANTSMWNSFLRLFKSKDVPPTKPKTWKDTVLTPRSPRMEMPTVCRSGGTVVLWDHQKAMLARCKFIETHPVWAEAKTRFDERYMKRNNVKESNKVMIGIMNDPPGAGKTYAMLSLIGTDAFNTLNLIVAPKNIVKQWQTSLRAMFGEPNNPYMPWATPNYESINKLYMNSAHFNKQRILLIDETLIDSFALAFENKVHRVIIDEVDNLTKFMTQPIDAEKVWFISASFDLDNPECKERLPYTFDAELMPNMVCCTDKTFIQMATQLEEPATEILQCEDADVRLFKGLVPDDVITALHALNIRPLLKHMEYMGSLEWITEDLVTWYLDELRRLIGKCGDDILECQMRKAEAQESGDMMLCDQMDVAIKGHQERKDTASSTLDELERRLKTYKAPKQSKHVVFEKVVIERILASQKDGKWLVFNDDLKGIIHAQEVMKAHGIKSEMLDGGSMEAVNKTIDAFKYGDTSVLLINSVLDGCGMNLENASHLLFMHATNPALVDQLMGRAQRYGRYGRLYVIGLFNDLEVETIEVS